MTLTTECEYITTDKGTELAADYLSRQQRLAFDTEATGLKVIGGESKLLLLQLGTEEVSYVFDARKISLPILKPILENKQILKIGHNLKFDYQMTKVHTGIELCGIFDTMLAYRLLTSGLIPNGQGGFIPAGFRDKGKKFFPYKGLGFLTRLFLGIELDKSIRENFIDMKYDKAFSKAELKYAADDVMVLHPLCDILGAKLAEEGLVDTALLEFEFLAPCAEMELAGVCINTEQWRKLIQQATSQANQFEDQMAEILAPLSEQNTLFGVSTININSPDQLLSVFKKLGHSLENTDAKTLKSIKEGDAGRLADLLLSYKAYKKLISTYGEAILRKINRHTGRLHCTFLQLGADTGRLSSEQPNLQNIPNDKEDEEVKLSFRDCFVAPADKVILTADFSQCVAGDEPVAVENGFVNISDFDWREHSIPSAEGRFLEHSNWHQSKGVRETIELFTEDGFSVRCTPDHRIRVANLEGVLGWKRADQLDEEDLVVLSRDWIARPYTPTTSDTDLFAYELLGYWVGDGSYSGGGIQFAKSDYEKYPFMYELLRVRCERVLGKKLKNYPNTNAWDLIGKDVQKWFQDHGCLPTWKSTTKETPSSVRQASALGVAAFLRGLFEADGWVVSTPTNNVVAFSTRSERLAKQVQLLLLGLGIFAKRASYEETTEVGGREYTGIQHRVSICDGFNISKFRDTVGFLSTEKSAILENVPERRAAYADTVPVSPKIFVEAISKLKVRSDWSRIRTRFFANYYNPISGVARMYSRTKAAELAKIYPNVDLIPEKHLAFSRFSHTEPRVECEVFDISVPSQRMFVAGGVFVHNCELRILAEESQDPKFLEIFRKDLDLHIITSQQVFGYTDAELDTYKKVKKKDSPDTRLEDFFSAEEITAYKKVSDFRSKTKVINFGIVYGLSAFSLAERFKIPMNEAEGILESYFKTYSGIKRWLDKNSHETIVNRHARTILGRKKYFTLADPNDEKAFKRSKNAVRRMGNNHVIQGCLQAKTRVLTSDGQVPIGKLYRSGNRPKFVWTGSGWAEYDVLNQGICQFATLRLSNGMSLPCDTRHEVLTVNDEGYQFRKVTELKKADKVCISLPKELEYGFDYSNFKYTYTPITHNGIPVEIDGLDEEFFYWMGYYYGDGNLFESNNTLSLCFGTTYDLEALKMEVDRCTQYFQRLGFNPTESQSGPNKFSVVVCGKGLVELYRQLGVTPGQVAKTKRLPESVYTASLRFRKSFLRGFLAADGYENHNSIHLCQKELLEDLQTIFHSCGIQSRISKPYKDKNGRTSYFLRLNRGMSAKSLGWTDGTYIRTTEVLHRFQVEEFCNKYTPAQFGHNNSEYTIAHRLSTNSGDASVYKVSQMTDQLLYSYSDFESLVIEETEGDTFTLSMFDDLHRYDSQGIISKNCNADITKRSIIDLWEAYHNIDGAKVLFTVHDEVVSECYKKDASFVAELKANVMRDAFHKFIKTVPVGPGDKVTVSVADHWAK